MERGVRDPAGGIVALLDVLEEHSSAIEYDLLTMGGGYRLRWLDDPQAHDFNWRDLRVAIEHAPRSSALTLAVDGSEAVEWDLTRQLLASMADTLNLLWWAKTEDGAANRNPPEPIERPGVQSSKKHYGSDPLPEDEMIEWLGPRFAHLKSDQ